MSGWPSADDAAAAFATALTEVAEAPEPRAAPAAAAAWRRWRAAAEVARTERGEVAAPIPGARGVIRWHEDKLEELTSSRTYKLAQRMQRASHLLPPMSVRVTTTGEPRALALAGLDGADGGPVVHLGAGGESADVVWREGTADGGDGPRVIAQAGAGLWRCAPWPVRDELFELAPPAERNVLVVGDESDREPGQQASGPPRRAAAGGGCPRAAVIWRRPRSSCSRNPTGGRCRPRRSQCSPHAGSWSCGSRRCRLACCPGSTTCRRGRRPAPQQLAAAAVLHWDAFDGRPRVRNDRRRAAPRIDRLCAARPRFGAGAAATLGAAGE